MGTSDSKVAQKPGKNKQTTPVISNKTQKDVSSDINENNHTAGLNDRRTQPDKTQESEIVECPNKYSLPNTPESIDTECLTTEDANVPVDYRNTDRSTSVHGSERKKRKKSKRNKTSRSQTSENHVLSPGTVDNDCDGFYRTKHTTPENTSDASGNTQGLLSELFKQRTYSDRNIESEKAEWPRTHAQDPAQRCVRQKRDCEIMSVDIQVENEENISPVRSPRADIESNRNDNASQQYVPSLTETNEIRPPGFTTQDIALNLTKQSLIPNERELLTEDNTETGNKMTMLPDTKSKADKQKKKKKKKQNMVGTMVHSNIAQTSDSESSPIITLRTSTVAENGMVSTVQINKLERETNKPGSIIKYERQLAALRNENNELKNRISKMISDLVTDNNPNIADISDQNRPMKLGDRFWELYNNEWTDALESLNSQNVEDNEAIGILLNIIVRIDTECRRVVTRDMEALETAILKVTGYSEMTNELKLSLKLYKDHRKKNYISSITPTYEFVQGLLPNGIVMTDTLDIYIRLGYELCWLMCIQDPPVYLVHHVEEDASFNKQYFKEYTKAGPFCDYVVWPLICLYENGPVLQKGVMQGKAGE